MRFGSVCSGIEAASVAWNPLGWKAAWLSEIEPFPCAVLAHHYPDVPNLGDMTALPERILSREVDAPDVFCGGTPCQAFSVAGMRKSLDDARGNLSLVFCEIANAIDNRRAADGEQPAIIFWENVPGVLSTKDNAFGCFLAGLAGEENPLEPPRGKWTNAGVVLGPQRAVAWRILDAQYFGVAQRRRRVFVVASARKGFDPASVLFEFDGVRRDTAPSREAGKVAPTIPSRSTGGGGLGTDFDCDGGVITMAHGQGGAEIGFDRGPTLTCNHEEAPIAAYGIRTANTSSNGWGIQEEVTHTLDCAQGVAVAHTTHTLRGEGFDASEDGTGRGTPLVPCTVPTLTSNGDAHSGYRDAEGLVPMFLRANEGRPDGRQSAHTEMISVKPIKETLTTDGHAQSAVAVPVSFAIQAGALRTNPASGPDGIGVQADHAYTLEARAEVQAVAFSSKDYGAGATTELAPTLRAMNHAESHANAGGQMAVMQAMQVRRLTPEECEALQGFPRSYTKIPWRKKPASECSDGPRYKALGNSWAVPNVAWIGRRIQNELNKAA